MARLIGNHLCSEPLGSAVSPLIILVCGHFDGTADKGKEAELIPCTELESEPLGVMVIQNRLGEVWLEKGP